MSPFIQTGAVRQYVAPRKVPALLTVDGQPKTSKGESRGYLTAVMHLAPHKLAGRGNVCPSASPECIVSCLGTAGRGGIGAGSLEQIASGTKTNAIQRARIARTHRFFDDAPQFVIDLQEEISAHVRRANRLGMIPCVRLNGTSDIQWEKVARRDLFDVFSDVQFYDYTKLPYDKRDSLALPLNYSLTMSYSGHNAEQCSHALHNGRNVAVVFAVKRGAPLPTHFGGWRVIDGDETDLRFLDPTPCIVGLRAKGRARNVRSPFIIQPTFHLR